MTIQDDEISLRRRQDKFVAALQDRHLSGAVVCSPEAVSWLTGAVIPTQRIMRDRLSMVVVSAATGTVELMTSTVEVNLASRQTSVPLHSYTEFVDEPIVAGVRRLRALDVQVDTVAVETKYLSVDAYKRLITAEPVPIYEPLGTWFDELRQVKDDNEIAVLGDLGRQTDAIVSEVFATTRAGVTERDVYNELLRAVHERGLSLNHATLSSGVNVHRSHHRADATVLEVGGLVRVDMGVTAGGYISDIARMAVVGEPSRRQAARYRYAVDAERWMIDQVRPGLDSRDLFTRWRERLDREGATTSMALVGHGIGLSLHEEPQLNEYYSPSLEPGMVLCVEPMVEYPDGEVYHVEDLIVVTESEPRYLTDPVGAETLTIIPGGSS